MNTSNQSYGVAAKAYLARARGRLLEDDKPGLFYAALELRCCVEARQAEYIEHLLAYQGQKLRPYRLGENREKIAKISGGKLIARMEFDFGDGAEFEGYHTPVPASLIKYCERSLGGLRHAQAEFRPQQDPWWSDVRDGLIEHYRMAWTSCQGNLLVPPLWSGAGKPAHPLIIEGTEKDKATLERMCNSVGARFRVYVEYLEQAPSSWVCDL